MNSNNSPASPEDNSTSRYQDRMTGMNNLRRYCAKVLMDLAMVLLPEEIRDNDLNGYEPSLEMRLVYTEYYRLLALYMRTDWIGISIKDSEDIKRQFLKGEHIHTRVTADNQLLWTEDSGDARARDVREAYRQARGDLPCGQAQHEMLGRMLYQLGVGGSYSTSTMHLVLQDPLFYQRVLTTTAGLFLTGLMPNSLVVQCKPCEPFLTDKYPTDDGAIYRQLEYRTHSGVSMFIRRFLMTDEWFHIDCSL